MSWCWVLKRSRLDINVSSFCFWEQSTDRELHIPLNEVAWNFCRWPEVTRGQESRNLWEKNSHLWVRWWWICIDLCRGLWSSTETNPGHCYVLRWGWKDRKVIQIWRSTLMGGTSAYIVTSPHRGESSWLSKTFRSWRVRHRSHYGVKSIDFTL